MRPLGPAARAVRVGALGILSAAAAVALVASCASSRPGFDESADAGEPDPFPTEDAGGPTPEARDPLTCEEAKTTRSYVGCDYWPTVTANSVWSIFDFAVVVANTASEQADVHVTGPSGIDEHHAVPAGSARKIFLPWVPELKGPDSSSCGSAVSLTSSVLARGGAYHVVSSVPVIVYQFNALEYRGEGGPVTDGGPKSWDACPGNMACTDPASANNGKTIGCFSFSNDASLLLPSTALTGSYRITGQKGWTEDSQFTVAKHIAGAYVTVTATQPDTEVAVQLGPRGNVVATADGTTISAATAGQVVRFKLDRAGDVAELVTDKGKQFDLSGSLVSADKPVMVIAGTPCINIPAGVAACDHIEELVPPAETLGKHYVVPVPSSPGGKPVGHVVRVYANTNPVELTYSPTKPASCPDRLEPGQFADCDVVSASFEVTGDTEFAIATFSLGGQLVDKSGGRGDPSASVAAAVEQYRRRYVLLAPDDYDESWLDVVAPAGAAVQVDGKVVDAGEPIGAGAFQLMRVPLTGGDAGVHRVEADRPVGAQVIGYGRSTSYQVPAGLNLSLLAPPPPPPR